MWKELRGAISFIASFNKVEMDETYLIDEEEKDNPDSQRLLLIEVKNTVKEEYSVLNELKNKKTLKNLLCIIVLFSVLIFNVDMINFYIKYIGGDININIFYMTTLKYITNSVLTSQSPNPQLI